jgi:methyl-accepting chemotaxis protein
MNNNRPDLSLIIREHGPKLLNHMKHKQKERGVNNADVINLAGVPLSSFDRLWNGDGIKMVPDHVARICLFLGISIDDFLHDTTNETKAKLEITEVAHEDVMTNIHEEIGRLKHTIEKMQAELNEKNAKIDSMKSIIREKTNEIISLHAQHSERMDRLTTALLDRHEQMHQMNHVHGQRIDAMNRELKDRYDHLYKMHMDLLGDKKIISDLIERSQKEDKK